MMRGYGGSTALQRMVSNYKTARRSAQLTPQHTPLSGIGMFTKMGEDRLESGLTDVMTGNMEMQQSAKLGSSFGSRSTNPWEAFLATPAQEEAQDESSSTSPFSAYSPHARGINMSIW